MARYSCLVLFVILFAGLFVVFSSVSVRAATVQGYAGWSDTATGINGVHVTCRLGLETQSVDTYTSGRGPGYYSFTLPDPAPRSLPERVYLTATYNGETKTYDALLTAEGFSYNFYFTRPTPTPTPTPTPVPVPRPVADFSASPTSGKAPLTVSFTSSSTGSITGYQWSFGDGTANSTAANPSHQYVNSGAYTVILTVSGPGGSSSLKKTGYISVSAPSVSTPTPTPTPKPPTITPIVTINPGLPGSTPPVVTINPNLPGSTPVVKPGSTSQVNPLPVTTALVRGIMGNNGWYTSNVQIKLTAEDAAVSGINTTMYKIEGDSPCATNGWVNYKDIITITDGIYQLYYYSTTKSGAIEDVNTIEIKVDTTPPTIVITLSPQQEQYNEGDYLSYHYTTVDSSKQGSTVRTSGIDESRTTVFHGVFIEIPMIRNNNLITYYVPVWSEVVSNDQPLDMSHPGINTVIVTAYDNAGHHGALSIDFDLRSSANDLKEGQSIWEENERDRKELENNMIKKKKDAMDVVTNMLNSLFGVIGKASEIRDS